MSQQIRTLAIRRHGVSVRFRLFSDGRVTAETKRSNRREVGADNGDLARATLGEWRYFCRVLAGDPPVEKMTNETV